MIDFSSAYKEIRERTYTNLCASPPCSLAATLQRENRECLIASLFDQICGAYEQDIIFL